MTPEYIQEEFEYHYYCLKKGIEMNEDEFEFYVVLNRERMEFLIFSSIEEARGVAENAAKGKPGRKFYIAKAVEVFESPNPVLHRYLKHDPRKRPESAHDELRARERQYPYGTIENSGKDRE